MAHGDAREGKWRGNWPTEWVAKLSYTTSEHGVSCITTADEHTSAASSRLNWRPRRFKWTRPFRRKTKSGFCACAITFQTQSAAENLMLAVATPESMYSRLNSRTKLYEWEPKSKVNLPVEALQSTHCETERLSVYLPTRNCFVEPMSGLVSVVFVYRSSLKMSIPLSNCTIVRKRVVIRFLWPEVLYIGYIFMPL
jgi:hypothetical protein